MKFTIIRSLLIHFALSVFASGVFAAAGDLDTSFNPATSSYVATSALQVDGKIIIGGDFTTVSGTAINRIARLNVDGSLDSSFNPGSGANHYVMSSALQADGKIFIAGDFTTVNGVVRNRIARLNVDGSLDSSFNPGTGANNVVRAIALQIDGKILIGGNFTTFNGASAMLIRLNADGSVDASFNYSSFVGSIKTIALQTDGKIIVGGGGITRLNTDGSLDASFNTGMGANSSVEAIVVQADGKILIGGYFTAVNGVTRNFIARLNADGSLDSSFNPGTGPNLTVEVIAVQANGKVVIGGAFWLVNAIFRSRIARLNADGSLDTSFHPGTGANNNVSTIALQTDGKIIIGGDFITVNGVARSRIARIHSGDSDGDGIQDAADQFSLNPAEWYDTDNDTIGNNADSDDDDDGIPDGLDPSPLSWIPLPVNGNYKGSTIKDSAAPL
jgi:uncharacterized delta-60 repeat protein